MNTWAVSLMIYSAGIVKLTETNLMRLTERREKRWQ